ncbi:MAG: cyclopropane-fatty-acyl-phospholipid synthase family protein [Pseudomonadota bacterium]
MGAREFHGDAVRGARLLDAGERFASTPGLISRLIAPGFAKIIDRVDAGLVNGVMIARLPDGSVRALGGRGKGFEAEITVKDWRALLRLATGGVIGFYQAYEAGEWESPDHTALLALMAANVRTLGDTARSSGPARWAGRIAHWLNRNNRAGSLRNISAHYDLGNDFYEQWLDPRMTYSSALGPLDEGLEVAQARKHQGIVDRLEGAQSVLEVGCGWGSLAQRIAESGADVTAISLSNEQLAFARANTSDKIDYRKQDYRDVRGAYDAIASVEMVEALGRFYWPDFMDCLARNLKPGGRAAIQYISIADDLFDDYAKNTDFIQAYIFPGGLLIRTSEFRALAERRGLEWRDQSDFGADYAATLKAWHNRFDQAVREGRLPEGFDARFIRLWKFYLSYCEAGFLSGNIDVHQVTLVKA